MPKILVAPWKGKGTNMLANEYRVIGTPAVLIVNFTSPIIFEKPDSTIKLEHKYPRAYYYKSKITPKGLIEFGQSFVAKKLKPLEADRILQLEYDDNYIPE
jgi:hypothetical protein